MESSNRARGMLGFTFVWFGQIVSVLCTNMSAFAFTIWVFEQTRSATAVGLVQVFFITPFLLISPIAGVMVDRYNRKLMMMTSDLIAGLATVAVLVLQAAGALHVWHLYVAAVFQGLGNAFQWPAYSAAISVMIPKEQYGRANGMMSLIEMGPAVFAPLLAGALLPIIGLTGVLSLDVATFLFAIGVLMLVHIPQPPRSEEGTQAAGNIFKEAAFGFRYIFSRPGLLGLQMVFFFGNLCSGVGFTLLAPMVLLRTSNDSPTLGLVLSAGAVGGVIGAIIMSIWGGFKRRIHGVLLGWAISSVLFALVGISVSTAFWIVMLTLSTLFAAIVNPSNQAIWQSKVAPDLQGRVFSARRLIAWMTNPLSPIIAGTLADYVFEPGMRAHGTLASIFGGLVPAGPGAGMGLLIFLSSLGGIAAGLGGYFVHHIRDVESVLPDHDVTLPEPAATSTA